MVKIRIKATSEIREVTRNEAHDLIEKGQAELITRPSFTPQTPYRTTQMKASLLK